MLEMKNALDGVFQDSTRSIRQTLYKHQGSDVIMVGKGCAAAWLPGADRRSGSMSAAQIEGMRRFGWADRANERPSSQSRTG